MTNRERINALLVVLLAIVAIKVGQQAYRWVSFGEEREELAVLRERVLDAGVEIVRTELRIDSLRREITRSDRDLEALRGTVDAYGKFAYQGALRSHLYAAYRTDLDAYNAKVRERNVRADAFNATLQQHRDAVALYNRLADSIRAIGTDIGDPYYPIPLPAEAATARGLVPNPE